MSLQQAISALNLTDLLRITWQAGFSQGVYQQASLSGNDHEAALSTSKAWIERVTHDPIWQMEITEELRVLVEAFVSANPPQTITGDAAEAIKATVRRGRSEVCAKCRKPIAAGAAEFDQNGGRIGLPYHPRCIPEGGTNA